MRLITAAAVLLVIVAGAGVLLFAGRQRRERQMLRWPLRGRQWAGQRPTSPARRSLRHSGRRLGNCEAPGNADSAARFRTPCAGERFVIRDQRGASSRSAAARVETIRGTVRVSVRVIVDAEGKVVAATSEDPGPSRYFERLSSKRRRSGCSHPPPRLDGSG